MPRLLGLKNQQGSEELLEHVLHGADLRVRERRQVWQRFERLFPDEIHRRPDLGVDHGFVGERGQVDPERAQGREPLRERGGQVVLEHLHVHLEPQHLGAIEPARGPLQAVGEDREGVVVLAREREHEAGLLRVLEAERVLRRPGVLRKAQEAELQVAQGGAEGGRVLGAAGGLEAHAGEGQALRGVRHEVAGAVQVADDVEEALALGEVQLAREQPADPEVEGGPVRLRDHRVGALLDLVMGEAVALAPGDHEPLARRRDRGGRTPLPASTRSPWRARRARTGCRSPRRA